MGLGLLQGLWRYLFFPLVPARETVISDEGPDDLWPPEPVPENPPGMVVRQWGLRLPDGTTAWGSWQSIPLDNPLDRMRTIATLQQTALQMGFAEGEQMADFLAHYAWATRDATVSTIFSDVNNTFALNDPAVADVSVNGKQEEEHASS